MKNLLLIVAAAIGLAVAGCQTIDTISEVGASIGVATGAINTNQAGSITRAAQAVGKTFDSITPEQEYYIGRAVAATVLTTYKPYDEQRATLYLNQIGQSMAGFSDRPETFRGYHFMIMDTDEVNAFGAPGGFILVSRGMLRCCRSEDAVAAVLAHEVGHVQNRDGLRAINKDRVSSALTIMASETAKTMGGEQLAQLTQQFEGSVKDVTSTLVNSGYSRRLEQQADAAAVTILKRAGYDPMALVGMLQGMDKTMKRDGRGFAKTHPDPKDRIADALKLIGSQPAPATAPAARQARFQAALAGI